MIQDRFNCLSLLSHSPHSIASTLSSSTCNSQVRVVHYPLWSFGVIWTCTTKPERSLRKLKYIREIARTERDVAREAQLLCHATKQGGTKVKETLTVRISTTPSSDRSSPTLPRYCEFLTLYFWLIFRTICVLDRTIWFVSRITQCALLTTWHLVEPCFHGCVSSTLYTLSVWASSLF